MLNQVTMIGRLVEKPEIKEEEDRKVCIITLAVPRSYKNEEGIYETDFVDCTLWSSVAERTAEWCNKGDIVCIKGRIQNLNNTAQLQLIAEKVSFLSSREE